VYENTSVISSKVNSPRTCKRLHFGVPISARSKTLSHAYKCPLYSFFPLFLLVYTEMLYNEATPALRPLLILPHQDLLTTDLFRLLPASACPIYLQWLSCLLHKDNEAINSYSHFAFVSQPYVRLSLCVLTIPLASAVALQTYTISAPVVPATVATQSKTHTWVWLGPL